MSLISAPLMGVEMGVFLEMVVLADFSGIALLCDFHSCLVNNCVQPWYGQNTKAWFEHLLYSGELYSTQHVGNYAAETCCLLLINSVIVIKNIS